MQSILERKVYKHFGINEFEDGAPVILIKKLNDSVPIHISPGNLNSILFDPKGLRKEFYGARFGVKKVTMVRNPAFIDNRADSTEEPFTTTLATIIR